MTPLRTIAAWIDGTIEGDGTVLVRDANVWEKAGPGDITFLDKQPNEVDLTRCTASAVIVALNWPGSCDGGPALVRVECPIEAFAHVFKRLRGLEEPPLQGIHPTAVIDPTAQLAPDVAVGAHAYIGKNVRIGERSIIGAGTVVGNDCSIGADCVLHPRVVVYPRTVLGNRVVVHAGAVLGADGFSYRSTSRGVVHIEHLGRLIIEDDVEIGANATIDRGTFEDTRISRGTKIDNLVQIAHNCTIGPNNMIAAQVGIAGSTSTGECVIIGGQAGIKDHLSIGDRVMIAAMAGVIADVDSDTTVIGIPALPEREAYKTYTVFRKLPQVWDDLRDVKKRVRKLEQWSGEGGDDQRCRPRRAG